MLKCVQFLSTQTNMATSQLFTLCFHGNNRESLAFISVSALTCTYPAKFTNGETYTLMQFCPNLVIVRLFSDVFLLEARMNFSL